jgi:CheY-like chemotaxis protein
VKILLVDDNPVNAEMMRFTLEKEGYLPLLADNGEAALACLDAHPDVDVMVTDVMMPGMDGLQLLEQIRRRPECTLLPVVVATSLANSTTVRQAVALQCRHFIVKPYTAHLLVETIRDALAGRGAVLEDKTQVASRLGVDAAGYERLALAFAELVSGRVETLAALAARDVPPAIDEPFKRDLRALAESAALLGAERLAKTFAAFGLPADDPPPEQRSGVYKALLTELRTLANALPLLPASGPPDAGPSAPDSTSSAAG